MISLKHIQRKCRLFVSKLEEKARQHPDDRLIAIQLDAARSLLAASATPDTDYRDLLEHLKAVKDTGTLGFEMWIFGEELQRNHELNWPGEMVKVKHFEDLQPEDAFYGAIWIEAEDLRCFGIQHAGKLDEGWVAQLPRLLVAKQMPVLLDLDHFFIGCTVSFPREIVHRGLAYLRTSDMQPYHVDVFHDDARCSIASESTDMSSDESLAVLKALALRNIYPASIEFPIAASAGNSAEASSSISCTFT